MYQLSFHVEFGCIQLALKSGDIEGDLDSIILQLVLDGMEHKYPEQINEISPTKTVAFKVLMQVLCLCYTQISSGNGLHKRPLHGNAVTTCFMRT